MPVIGLTGGIGSGKSTVSKRLREMGARVIDADQLSRDAVKPGSHCWTEIVRNFGREILLPDGNLNRVKLAELVFNNAEARKLLNGIIHPEVGRIVLNRIREYIDEKENAPPALVIEAPLLIETGLHELVDEVWLVVVDEESQVKRVMKRDNLNADEVRQRVSAQIPQSEKIKFAHKIIDNNGPLEDAIKQVDYLWRELTKKHI